MNEKETYEILSRFYIDCLKFWNKEVNERGFATDLKIEELAIKDIENIKNNPYSPNGKVLDIETKEKWVADMKKIIN